MSPKHFHEKIKIHSLKIMPRQAVILSKDASSYQQLLAAYALEDLTLHACSTVEQANAVAQECEILLGDPDLVQQVLTSMTQLRWVQSTWAGVTPLLQMPERHYRLTNIKGVFGPLMSEYVFGHLLAHERNLFEHHHAQTRCQWHPIRPGTLQRKVIGFLGLGSIGLYLAGTAKHFGMQTFGCSRNPRPHPNLDALFRPSQLPEMLARTDYLVACLPSTTQTRNLLDEKVFSAIKPGALLINVGRGDLIDEEALLYALGTGRLKGAVLDVFREEPLPVQHPFWTTENIIVTSHTAAPSFPEDIVPIFVENYKRYRKGEPLMYQVDFERGY